MNARQRDALTVFAATAILLGAVSAGLGVLSVSLPAEATNVSLTLYGDATSGWSFTPASETNPGPTIAATVGDQVTIHMISDDGIIHGVFIDFNDNGFIDASPDVSSSIGTDVAFSFIVPATPGTHYYYCSVHSPDANNMYNPGAPMYGEFVVNQRPSATFAAPTATTSWTGGVSHDIAFDLTDEDTPASLAVWVNYSYAGGTQTGTIAGPIAGTANPNRVSWTPGLFSATDVRLNVTARDTQGAYGYSLSAPFEVDSSAPAIATRSPASGATGVSLNSNVRVTWSEGMNETASGAADAFAVRRTTNGAWIPGAVSWFPDGTQMTFTPSTLWDATTVFEVHVNATAKDDSDPGNAFAGPDIWQFTTGTSSDVTPPTITNVVASPPTQDPGGTVAILADVTDNIRVASVNAHVLGPSTDVNLTMTNPTGPTWTAARAYSVTGTYSFTVWAFDTAGNFASQSGSFTIRDRTAPVIASVVATPSSTTPNGAVNITAVVTDNGVVASVSAHVVGPSLLNVNLTMALGSGFTWYINRTYGAIGTYTFTVWAVDAAGNANSRTGTFSIGPSAPTGVAAVALANGTIRVTWSAVTSGSVAGYNVYRATSASGPFTKLTSTLVPASGPLEYVDANVQAGTTYYYAVTAVDTNSNESPQSATASATVSISAPPPGPDYTIWIVLAIVIGLAAVVLLLVRRRRRP